MLEQGLSHLSLASFAGAIGKSERTVQRYIRQGRVSTVDVGGVVRIPKEELTRFPSFQTNLAGYFQPATVVHDDNVKPHDDMSSSISSLSTDGDKSSSTVDKLGDSDFTSVEAVLVDYVVNIKPVSSDDDAGKSASDTMSTFDDVGSGEVDDTQPMTRGFVPIERHESAVMRLGWLEAKLEMSQKMLGDGGAREQELHAREVELQQQLAAEVETRRQAELRALEAETKLAVLEQKQGQSWFKRVFFREL